MTAPSSGPPLPVAPGTVVHVYRNLNRSRPDAAVWSVRHGSRVVAHVRELTLEDATFRIQPGGRDRARRSGQRNVHAYVAGTVAGPAPVGRWVTVAYDPFGDATFTAAGEPLHTAAWVRVDAYGCSALR